MSANETYILFELGDTSYGISSREVLHIEMLEHITPLPNSRGAVEGVVFSRGQVIPALDLRTRFGFPAAPRTPRTRLIFLRHEQRSVALIVDSAREFRALAPDAIKPIGDTLSGVRNNYLAGVATVGDRLVLLLDVAAVLAFEPADAPPATPALQTTA